MKVKLIKVGRTYVTPNGGERRLQKIERKDGRYHAGYVPIDRKGNEGTLRWVKLETFANEVLAESIS